MSPKLKGHELQADRDRELGAARLFFNDFRAFRLRLPRSDDPLRRFADEAIGQSAMAEPECWEPELVQRTGSLSSRSSLSINPEDIDKKLVPWSCWLGS